MLTLDIHALDLNIKPSLLRVTSRSTTMDALALDFDDDDNFIDRSLSSMDDFINETKNDRGVARPPALFAAQRLTTNDLIDIGTFCDRAIDFSVIADPKVRVCFLQSMNQFQKKNNGRQVNMESR